jgi:hypothetical protein
MKKIKIKQRIENACNAFFADEFFEADNSLSLRNESTFLPNDESEDFTSENSALETILKQVFFFFPGTFVLYILSACFTIIFIGTFVKKSGMTPAFEMGLMGMVFLAAVLMTWLGLGDIRKLKHFVIPASIISVGIVFGAVVTFILLAMPVYFRFYFRDDFLLYIFPLALIVPFLAKGWIDGKIEK